MYRSTLNIGRRGVVLHAISAIDIALWDLLGEAARRARLQSCSAGRCVRRCRPMRAGSTPPRISTRSASEAASWAAQGFSAVKQRLPYGRSTAATGIARNVELVRTVVDAVGPDVDVMADAYMSWDVGYAVRCIRAIEDAGIRLRWLEEPTIPDDIAGLARIRAAVSTPIAAGEHEATRFGFRDLVTAGAVDVLQPDVNRLGGITEARRVWALGETFGLEVVPHLGFAHNAHLAIASLATPLLEYMPPPPSPDAADEDQIFWVAFPDEPRAVDGIVTLSDRPGPRREPRPLGAGGGMTSGVGLPEPPINTMLETPVDLDVLSAIERRVLWLAVRIVDYANRERPKGDALKVGGHQASSASMVTLMTALYLAELQAEDRVSVKPHASPVLHAIEYLLGRLDGSYLTRLRDFGGLQSYPSRTKDPFPVDYSTGSVGLGSAAPLFGALADRFTQSRLGVLDRRSLHLAARRRGARRGQHLGGGRRAADAPARQRPLDRRSQPAVARPRDPRDPRGRARAALPDERLGRDRAEVRAPAPRGPRPRRAARSCSRRIDEMPNEQYQSLFGASEEVVRETVSSGLERRRSPAARAAARPLPRRGRRRSSATSAATTSATSSTRSGCARGRRDRPTVIFAYTIKGYGLEIAGRPMNHSALLTEEQIDALPRELRPHARERVGRASRRARRSSASSSGRGERLDRGQRPRRPPHRRCRRRCRRATPAATSTQAAFGHIAARPLPRRRRRRAARHGRARRLGLDEPRRLHQQDRHLGPRRGADLRPRWRTRRSSGGSARAGSTSRSASPR